MPGGGGAVACGGICSAHAIAAGLLLVHGGFAAWGLLALSLGLQAMLQLLRGHSLLSTTLLAFPTACHVWVWPAAFAHPSAQRLVRMLLLLRRRWHVM